MPACRNDRDGSGDFGPGSIFTYAGSVRVGVKTDARVVPEPGRIVRAFHAEPDALPALTDARADAAAGV